MREMAPQRTWRWLRVAATWLPCSLMTAASAVPAAAQGHFAIRNVRVFDGERVIPSATVLVEAGTIAAVGPSVAVPPGGRVVEGAGRTLLPGLIDAHTHTIVPTALEAAIAFGVTTQLDMFTIATLAAQLRAEQAAGRADARADLVAGEPLGVEGPPLLRAG